MIHKDRLALLEIGSLYSNYLINIIPKYIFNINIRNIFLIHFNHIHIREFFFFLYNHFNTQLKMLIDLASADFISCNRRFLNIYNLLSLNFNSRVFCKVWISKYLRIESLTFLYMNIS
jgi:NADH:ubiquinone oxidoreductase subunit C